MLFDSHAHVDDPDFDQDRAAVIDRAKANGVSWFLNPGADMASSARAVALAAQYEHIYAAVGIHPQDAKDAVDHDYDQLAEWTNQPKVVAIGEIGLDYYYETSPREVQQAVLVRHIDLARQLHKPIIIHDRDAHGDILSIIKREAKGVTGVFHCFSGSWEMALEVMKLGFYISFAGPVTFKNAAKLQAIAKAAPLERILVETDSPYLTPQPYRGKRNEPGYVRLVAEQVANLRRIDLATLAAATTANVRNLFNIA